MKSNSKMHFEISERKILLRVFDVFFVLGILYLLGIIFHFDYFKITQFNFSWTIILTIYLLFFGSVFDLYNLQCSSNQFMTIKSILLASTFTVVFYLLTPIITPSLPKNRFQIVLFYLAIFLALLIWRMLYIRLFASTRFMKNIVLVCEASQLKELYTGLQKGDPNFKIIGFVNSDTENASDFYFDYIKHVKLSKLEKFIRKNDISEIVIASQNTETISVELYNKLLFFLENGVIIREYTQVYENLTQRIPVQYAARDFYKYFPFSRSNSNKLYLLTIRFFELFFSILGLSVGVAILPFLLLGNLLGNRGNLFYTQERIGKNGIPFKIYKLRSMVKNAESNGAVFATANDSRITPFGKFLRKSRLDEVPQFINVLKGDMAIIGPRPERAVFVQKIAGIMPFYHTRHVIKPGLTGWAQVNYSYGESIDDSLVKLQYDLYYIKHRSIFLDINIAIKTISTIVFYKGQ